MPDYELPRVLPHQWSPVEHTPFGAIYHRRDGLMVIVTQASELDGRQWLHVSCSRRSRLPSWDDLRKVKLLFVGRDRKAIQVLPPEAEYVNFHPYCLHLWCCLDEDPLPDFTHGTGLV